MHSSHDYWHVELVLARKIPLGGCQPAVCRHCQLSARCRRCRSQQDLTELSCGRPCERRSHLSAEAVAPSQNEAPRFTSDSHRLRNRPWGRNFFLEGLTHTANVRPSNGNSSQLWRLFEPAKVTVNKEEVCREGAHHLWSLSQWGIDPIKPIS